LIAKRAWPEREMMLLTFSGGERWRREGRDSSRGDSIKKLNLIKLFWINFDLLSIN